MHLAGGALGTWARIAVAASAALSAAVSGHGPAPANATTVDSYFRGVAVIPGGGAWAVGTQAPLGPVSKGFIERADGTVWRLFPSPDVGGASAASELSGVAAASATSAWAVGAVNDGETTRTLVEHWTGKAWKRTASPNPGGSPGVSSLAAVSALSPSSAWAVGSFLTSSIVEPMFHQTLVEHWNNKAWRVQPSPSPGPADSSLMGVSALSPSDVWAVGTFTDDSGWDQTLIEHWNGSVWKQVKSPNPGGPLHSNLLFAVAATSQSNVFAVGAYVDSRGDETLIERWNGRSWKQVPSPSGPSGPGTSFLYDVAALPPATAWAAGIYVKAGVDQTLIEHWSRGSWKVVRSPDPGAPARYSFLSGIAVSSPSNAWATGFYQRGSPLDRTLAEHWNGTTWKTVISP